MWSPARGCKPEDIQRWRPIVQTVEWSARHRRGPKYHACQLYPTIPTKFCTLQEFETKIHVFQICYKRTWIQDLSYWLQKYKISLKLNSFWASLINHETGHIFYIQPFWLHQFEVGVHLMLTVNNRTILTMMPPRKGDSTIETSYTAPAM